jgi:hypothetical protein
MGCWGLKMASAELRADQRLDLIHWNAAIVAVGGDDVGIPLDQEIPPHTAARLLQQVVVQALAKGAPPSLAPTVPYVVDDRENVVPMPTTGKRKEHDPLSVRRKSNK